MIRPFEGVDDTDPDDEVGQGAADVKGGKRRAKSAVSKSAEKRPKVTATKPFKMTLRSENSHWKFVGIKQL